MVRGPYTRGSFISGKFCPVPGGYILVSSTCLGGTRDDYGYDGRDMTPGTFEIVGYTSSPAHSGEFSAAMPGSCGGGPEQPHFFP
ncbi:MAG: hypothetical protein APR53_01990 [Methanoculleus sp. SDB]|nr:MAG: hypothetical protein APR53_01990 [Methanoculleus sp. SDB]